MSSVCASEKASTCCFEVLSNPLPVLVRKALYVLVSIAIPISSVSFLALLCIVGQLDTVLAAVFSFEVQLLTIRHLQRQKSFQPVPLQWRQISMTAGCGSVEPLKSIRSQASERCPGAPIEVQLRRTPEGALMVKHHYSQAAAGPRIGPGRTLQASSAVLRGDPGKMIADNLEVGLQTLSHDENSKSLKIAFSMGLQRREPRMPNAA